MGVEGEKYVAAGDFLTVNFKSLVGMRTGHLAVNCCFLPAAIKDADAADGINELGKGMLNRLGIERDFQRGRGRVGVRQNAPFSTSSLLREVKVTKCDGDRRESSKPERNIRVVKGQK